MKIILKRSPYRLKIIAYRFDSIYLSTLFCASVQFQFMQFYRRSSHLLLLSGFFEKKISLCMVHFRFQSKKISFFLEKLFVIEKG